MNYLRSTQKKKLNYLQKKFLMWAGCLLLGSITILAHAQTDPTIISWMLNTSGAVGSSSDSEIHSFVSQYPADVQRVRYDNNDVFINSSSIPSHPIGSFDDGNPSIPVDALGLYTFPRVQPLESGTHPGTGLGAVGIFVNGVGMYNYSDAESFMDQNVWFNNAIVVRASGMDSGLGHPSPLMMGPPPRAASTSKVADDHSHLGIAAGDIHVHGEEGVKNLSSRGVIMDPTVSGYYHYHQQPVLMREQLGDNGSAHSPIIGWVFDGIPVYGPYAFDNINGTGGIVRIESSYQIRSITERTKLADGTILVGPEIGPPINPTFPLGYFIEDFEYVNGLGHLDEYNGRFAETPEYPTGIYAYFGTIDLSSDSSFPYLMGSNYYADPISDNLNQTVTVPGGVQEYFGATQVEDWMDY